MWISILHTWGQAERRHWLFWNLGSPMVNSACLNRLFCASCPWLIFRKKQLFSMSGQPPRGHGLLLSSAAPSTRDFPSLSTRVSSPDFLNLPVKVRASQGTPRELRAIHDHEVRGESYDSKRAAKCLGRGWGLFLGRGLFLSYVETHPPTHLPHNMPK